MKLQGVSPHTKKVVEELEEFHLKSWVSQSSGKTASILKHFNEEAEKEVKVEEKKEGEEKCEKFKGGD